MAAALTWVRSALERASANGPSCDWSGTVVATSAARSDLSRGPLARGVLLAPGPTLVVAPPQAAAVSAAANRTVDQPSRSTAHESHRSQRANAADGTQPRSSDGERLSGSGWPTGMTPTGTKSAGMPSSSFRAWMLAGYRRAGEAGSQPRVDGRQRDEHHGHADVHPPVRHGPARLLARVVDLVGLVVPIVVDPLTDAGDEDRGARADPGVPALLRHLVLVVQLGDPLAHRGIRHDHEPLALAEAGAGRPLGDRGDALEHFAGHRLFGEVADHAPPPARPR